MSRRPTNNELNGSFIPEHQSATQLPTLGQQHRQQGDKTTNKLRYIKPALRHV